MDGQDTQDKNNLCIHVRLADYRLFIQLSVGLSVT